MWTTLANIGWAISAILALWMLYDWYKLWLNDSAVEITG